MEGPAVHDELGDVRGSRVLDLGCGDAEIGRELLRAGASRYLGIDGSRAMIRAATQTLKGTAGEVRLADIEDLGEPPGSFDLVLSRMALHYVADLRTVLRACHSCLAPAGRFVFTVVHPVITSHDARVSPPGPRQSWVVDDYFLSGPRSQRWLGATTIWHHRTVEGYVTALREAGFAITNLGECPPRRELFDDDAEYARRSRIPLVLLLASSRVPAPLVP